MALPFCTLKNPLPKGFDFLGGQLLLKFRWGHHLIGIFRSDPVPSLAVLQAVADKGRKTIQFTKRMLFQIQT